MRVRIGLLLVLAIGVVLFLPGIAQAATTGGGGLPWDTPLQTLRDDLTGPVAFTFGLLALFISGIALVFGGEMSHFVRGLLFAVLVVSLLTNIIGVASALGIAGAVV